MNSQAMAKTDMGVDALVSIFAVEVHDRAVEIDPDNIQDWYSLTLGWAIAKGLPPDAALAFARHIRYRTTLG